MSETTSEPLTALSDPHSVRTYLVEDEGDEEPGMTPEEIDEFLRKPVPPMREQPAE